ncbi:MAG: hypothetical protein VW837_04690 [Gammaproteobacteria bacterium]|jgi:hypothetical protein
MINNNKFKILFVLAALFFTNTYAQTIEVSQDIKDACKSFEKGTAFWSDTENVCSQTFKTKDAEIIHYVGGWSIEGAAGYGQLYVYNSKDGSLIASYKGQFQDSSFHGFGHFEETYFNTDGDNVTRTSIGNWDKNAAHGFIYQKIVNNDNHEVSIFYGDMINGQKDGNSLVFKDKYIVDNVIWKENKYLSHKPSQLFSDEIANAWIQYKYFDSAAILQKDNDMKIIQISKNK